MLARFGPFRVTAFGTGELQLGSPKRCSYRVAQAEDGSCYLACSLRNMSEFPFGILPDRMRLSLVGTCRDGAVSVSPCDGRVLKSTAILQHPVRVTVVFGIRHFTIEPKHAVASKARRKRFVITNMRIDGKTPLAVNVVWHGQAVSATLAELDGQSGPARGRRSTRDAHPAATLSIPSEAEEPEGLADALCSILSIAQGQKVQWIAAQELDEANELLRDESLNRAVGRSASMPIIDPMWLETQAFVQGVFTRFVSIAEQWDMSRIIDAFCDARRDDDFLESRGVKLAVVLEMLKAQYLTNRDPLRGRMLPDDQFDAMRERLTHAVDQVGKDSGLNNRVRRALRAKVGEFNRRPFRWVLRELCDELGLAIPDCERDKIATIRNNLVHEGRFSTGALEDRRKENLPAYLLLLSFLDRALLRLLRYEGPFYDRRELDADDRKAHIDEDGTVAKTHF